MSTGNLERRIESLEKDAASRICTWLDLCDAADAPPGTTFTVSPAMQGLFEQLEKEGSI